MYYKTKTISPHPESPAHGVAGTDLCPECFEIEQDELRCPQCGTIFDGGLCDDRTDTIREIELDECWDEIEDNPRNDLL
jgi:hypothetical protein